MLPQESVFRKTVPTVLRDYVLTLFAFISLLSLTILARTYSGQKAATVCSLFLLVLLFAAAWNGYGLGLLVLALIAYVVPRFIAAAPPKPVDLFSFGLLAFSMLLFSHLGATKRRTEATLREAAERLEQRVAERTQELQRNQEQLREQEEQLRHAQRLESIGTLAGGIAHDFNNILLAICGNAEFLSDELRPGHPGLHEVAEIQKAAARATDLVRQILTFSRQQETKRTAVKLNLVVDEALKLLRSTLPAMIEIQTSFDPSTPEVLADSTQVHQVMMNLGTNAAHAMGSAGGVLEVSIAPLAVDSELARVSAELHVGLYVLLSVSDSGCGMDKSTTSRIFEPFFTTKALGKGTGLGLAVVHGIMKKHDGAVVVHSEPGKGTTFHLYFPAAGPVTEEKPHAPIETPRGMGEHILCIDDERPIIAVVTRTLERLGYKVTGHGYASSALQEFRARPNEFDAVVTDLALRGMSGLDLATELLRLRPGLPIILTSGYFSPEDTERARLLGIQELIQKPNTLGEVGNALHRTLCQARSRA